jgi:hypothetical protein
VLGRSIVVHTRRPPAWAALSEIEAALLDVLRRGGSTSELSPKQTTVTILRLLAERDCYQRIERAAYSEPPRVRAMIGALGAELGMDPKLLRSLRASLSPLSRFNFGVLKMLPTANARQAIT